MFNAVSNALLFVIEVIKRVINWLLSTGISYHVLRLFALGIAVSLLFLAIKLIKSSIWGN